MEFFERIINKLSRLFVDYKRKGVQLNSHTTSVDANANWFDPIQVGPSTLAQVWPSLEHVASTRGKLDSRLPPTFGQV